MQAETQVLYKQDFLNMAHMLPLAAHLPKADLFPLGKMSSHHVVRLLNVDTNPRGRQGRESECSIRVSVSALAAIIGMLFLPEELLAATAAIGISLGGWSLIRLRYWWW